MWNNVRFAKFHIQRKKDILMQLSSSPAAQKVEVENAVLLDNG